jgi:hypothetical protein
MYERLIGPYPYDKFALVENFWETGFGMPSFTLLGPKIIRFPFIIVSSYPHEILHNWWGNSVYPEYGSGNWTEGLTAYLSDHLIKEQQGAGADYRLTSLQKYADYVVTERDFPLAGFTSRYGSPSEAIGYGKSLMFFHMLRLELGDETFRAGLREFYRTNRFRTAAFDDLKKSFEGVSRKDLTAEFYQWVRRTGAPEIRISNARAEKTDSGYRLTARLEQVQADKPYRLRVPLALTLEGRKQAYQEVVNVSSEKTELSLALPARPLRIDADPEFDLFRRLDRGEIPPTLSQALGSRRMLVILPSRAKDELLTAYRGLAGLLRGAGPDVVEVRLDSDVEALPADRAVVVMGWENRFLGDVTSTLSRYDLALDDADVRIGKTKMPRTDRSVVLSSRQSGMAQAPLVFIATDAAGALAGLGRKLPHYHRYSYLVFEGHEPENVAKGRWPVIDSPLTVFVTDDTGRVVRTDMGSLAAREALTQVPSVFSADRMMEVIGFLSGDDLAGRGFGSPGLEKAAEYVARQFRDAGLVPAAEGEESYFQVWQAAGGEGKGLATLKNVVGIIPGTSSRFAGESVVVGAHYDHLGLGWPDVRGDNRGRVHPGADDNASGVAVLIELARALAKGAKPGRTLVFVAFAGEEAGKLGSKHYVTRRERYPAGKVIGMVNLDTVGRLGKGKLLALGAQSAREWVHILRGAGFVTGVEIDAVAEDLDSGDQVSFTEAGVPAIQLFTGPHADYHRPTDTAEKIDHEGLVKVAAVAQEIIEYLSKRQEPLMTAARPAGKAAGGQRKSSLGTIPDFSYAGEGARLSGVMAGSPAEKGGLRAGDVIIGINENPVEGLRDLSEILKSLDPGSRVLIMLLREEKETALEVVLDTK